MATAETTEQIGAIYELEGNKKGMEVDVFKHGGVRFVGEGVSSICAGALAAVTSFLLSAKIGIAVPFAVVVVLLIISSP